MLNPDGGIIGNYRTSLSGDDLNWQWANPCSMKHPEIYYTKQLIAKTIESRPIELFVDCHGHSNKKNVFIYGIMDKCLSKKEKIFPLLFSKRCQSFSYQDCSFVLSKDKENTAWAVINREFGIKNSYTLEASFAGPDQGKFAGCHFTPS